MMCGNLPGSRGSASRGFVVVHVEGVERIPRRILGQFAGRLVGAVDRKTVEGEADQRRVGGAVVGSRAISRRPGTCGSGTRSGLGWPQQRSSRQMASTRSASNGLKKITPFTATPIGPPASARFSLCCSPWQRGCGFSCGSSGIGQDLPLLLDVVGIAVEARQRSGNGPWDDWGVLCLND